jgi:hypothetical protein
MNQGGRRSRAPTSYSKEGEAEKSEALDDFQISQRVKL